MKSFVLAGVVGALFFVGAGQAFAATLNFNTANGMPGTAVTISGTGYAAYEPVAVWFGPSRSTTTSSGSAYADQSGYFSIPMTVPWTAAGNASVTAQGLSSGITAYGTFYVGQGTQPITTLQGSLATSPQDGAPGTGIVVSGSAFPRSSFITIYFGTTAAATVSSDSNGSFQTTIAVPNLPSGRVTLGATGMDPYNPPSFYIDPGGSSSVPTGIASLSLSTASGAPGTSIGVNGSGFYPNETVVIQFGSFSTSVVANAFGAFSMVLSAPAASGSQNITVTAMGQQSGRGAGVVFNDVVTIPPQSSAPDNATLQAEIVALQNEIARLLAIISAWTGRSY